MITNREFTQNVNSHCFKLNRSYSVSFNLSNVGEIFRVESQRTVFKFRKRKLTFFCWVYLPHEASRCRSRAAAAKKGTKKRAARAKLLI